jgi:hypothetical protein
MFKLLFLLTALSAFFFTDNVEGVQLGVVGGLVSGLVNLSRGVGGGKEKDALKQVRDLYGDLPLPEYENLIAPQLYSTGEMSPEIYDAIIRGDTPQIEEDPALRESQLTGLKGMEQVAREGLPLRDRLAAQDAQRSLSQELTRADEGVLSNLKQRGRAGGGTELAARLATQGRAAETARGIGSDLAQQAVTNRLGALQQLPGLAGQIRGQDVNTSAQNAAMQQRYNEFVSNLQTEAAMNSTNAKNRAQEMNLGNRQRIADSNVGAKYGASIDRNQLQNQMFDARQSKIGGQAGALGALGQFYTDRETAKQRQIQAAGAGFDNASTSIIGAAL